MTDPSPTNLAPSRFGCPGPTRPWWVSWPATPAPPQWPPTPSTCACCASGAPPRRLDLLQQSRAHLEIFARYLETERGNCPTTIHRRLSTHKCLYRIAEVDRYLDRSPAATHIRLPRLFKDETKTLGLLTVSALIAVSGVSGT